MLYFYFWLMIMIDYILSLIYCILNGEFIALLVSFSFSSLCFFNISESHIKSKINFHIMYLVMPKLLMNIKSLNNFVTWNCCIIVHWIVTNCKLINNNFITINNGWIRFLDIVSCPSVDYQIELNSIELLVEVRNRRRQ